MLPSLPRVVPSRKPSVRWVQVYHRKQGCLEKAISILTPLGVHGNYYTLGKAIGQQLEKYRDRECCQGWQVRNSLWPITCVARMQMFGVSPWRSHPGLNCLQKGLIPSERVLKQEVYPRGEVNGVSCFYNSSPQENGIGKS